MPDEFKIRDARLKGLVITVIAVTVLSYARSFFIPIAIGILLAFVVSPLVRLFEKLHIGRLASVIMVLLLGICGLIGFLWILSSQMVELSANLSTYKGNFVERIRDFQQLAPPELAQAGEAISEIKESVENETQSDAQPAESRGDTRDPAAFGGGLSSLFQSDRQQPVDVAVVSMPDSLMSQIGQVLGPTLGPLGVLGVGIMLAIFMLLDREDFRNRIVQLFGSTNLAVTTTAINEATERTTRWLRTMVIINAIYGSSVWIGLELFGIPNALLWGTVGFFARFVPYLAPWIAAPIPVFLSLSIVDGWLLPLGVIAMYVVFELMVNTVLEPILYGRSVGLTPIGIIVAAIFWTWLWGPIGLIITVPVTMWMVVLGKHIPQMSQFTLLFGDLSKMPSYHSLYQRLLAYDANEANQLLERHLQDHGLSDVMENVIIPLLSRLETDRNAGYVSDPHAEFIFETLIETFERFPQQHAAGSDEDDDVKPAAVLTQPSLMVVPENSEADCVLAESLQAACQLELSFAVETADPMLLSNELVERIRDGSYDVVVFCCSDMRQNRKRRYVGKRLASAGCAVSIYALEMGVGPQVRFAPRSNRELGTSVASFSELVERLKQFKPRRRKDVPPAARNAETDAALPDSLQTA